MSNAFNDWAATRDRDAAFASTTEPRTPDGSPTTEADAIKNAALPSGNYSGNSTYSRVEWNVPIPTRALLPTTDRDAQAQEQDGFVEVLSIVQRRGDPNYGLMAPNDAGQLVAVNLRSYA